MVGWKKDFIASVHVDSPPFWLGGCCVAAEVRQHTLVEGLIDTNTHWFFPSGWTGDHLLRKCDCCRGGTSPWFAWTQWSFTWTLSHDVLDMVCMVPSRLSCLCALLRRGVEQCIAKPGEVVFPCQRSNVPSMHCQRVDQDCPGDNMDLNIEGSWQLCVDLDVCMVPSRQCARHVEVVPRTLSRSGSLCSCSSQRLLRFFLRPSYRLGVARQLLVWILLYCAMLDSTVDTCVLPFSCVSLVSAVTFSVSVLLTSTEDINATRDEFPSSLAR